MKKVNKLKKHIINLTGQWNKICMSFFTDIKKTPFYKDYQQSSINVKGSILMGVVAWICTLIYFTIYGIVLAASIIEPLIPFVRSGGIYLPIYSKPFLHKMCITNTELFWYQKFDLDLLKKMFPAINPLIFKDIENAQGHPTFRLEGIIEGQRTWIMNVITSNPHFRNTLQIPSVTERYITNNLRRDGIIGVQETEKLIIRGEKIQKPQLLDMLLDYTKQDVRFQDDLALAPLNTVSNAEKIRYIGDRPEDLPSLVEASSEEIQENFLANTNVLEQGIVLAQNFQKPFYKSSGLTDDDIVLGDL